MVKREERGKQMNLALISFRFGNQLTSLFAPSWTAKRALNKFLTPRKFIQKPWEIEAESLGIRFNLNQQISAVRWQPNSDKSISKKVLLVHGWESRATQMYSLVPTLLKLNYQVVAVDMPGHGKSEGIISDADKFAEAVVLAQEKLGKFDVIIGHSMGAGAAAIALSRGIDCGKLVLISGPSSVENVIRRFSSFIGLNSNAINWFIEHCTEQVGVAPSVLDSTRLLSIVETPTLIIHDKDDVEVPITESKRLLPVFSNCELFITEGLGHRRILKSEQTLQKITDFLTNSQVMA